MSDKKKKKTVMNLGEFLADANTGSWADDTSSLPSAPAAVENSSSSFGARNDRYSDRSGGREEHYESSFSAIDLTKVPENKPFTAFVGNLSYDAAEEHLSELFKGIPTVEVKIVRDRATNRSKGFGYVEFETRDDLLKAFELQGNDILGRRVKLDVAGPVREARRDDRGGYAPAPRKPDLDTNWRERSANDNSGNSFSSSRRPERREEDSRDYHRRDNAEPTRKPYSRYEPDNREWRARA